MGAVMQLIKITDIKNKEFLYKSEFCIFFYLLLLYCGNEIQGVPAVLPNNLKKFLKTLDRKYIQEEID